MVYAVFSNVQTTLLTAHVVRASACERGYKYNWEKMQNKDSEKVPALGLHKKRDFFCRPFGKAEKPQERFLFCIIYTLLISERGRRRPDYLRGTQASSDYPHLCGMGVFVV